jgi:hypothetical protein
VIRTVWLAVLCSIGLGAMVVIRAETRMPPPTVRPPPEQTTIGESSSQDTLTKADKLEIAFVRDRVAPKPVMLVTTAADQTPSRPSSPVATMHNVRRHRHDHNAKKSAAVSAGRRIKSPEPKKARNVDREKPMVDLRPCRRPEGFSGLLRVLNLTPACDT